MALFDPPLSAKEVASAFPHLEVIDTLHTGGQGAVFRAKDAALDGALKIYGPGTEFVRVEREIALLSELRSEHVVTLYSHGSKQIRGQILPFTYAEYLPGDDLSKAKIEWDDSTIRALMRDIAKGIEALWDRKVVHRDLKPMNILRRLNGRFVVIDLGLAKFIDRSAVTGQGLVAGTWGYMSPEQAVGRRALTFKSDIFALAVVAYELAAKCHPFLGQQQLVGRVRPRPLHELSRVDRATSTLIDQMLAPDPLKRPRFCRDVYDQC